MKARLDFSNVSDGFSPIPEGDYTCFLFNVDMKPTKKGDDMYVLTLKVADGEHKGRQLFYNLPVLKQTMWKIKETLEVFGMDIPKSAVDIDFDDLLGQKVVAHVKVGEYNGKANNEIVNLSQSDGSVSVEEDGDEPF